MVDHIAGLFVAMMAAVFLYILVHDCMGLTDHVIWSDSMIGADILGVLCAAMGISAE